MPESKEVWTYTGRRFDGERLRFRWEDESGAGHTFAKNIVKHAPIGGDYEVTSTEDGQSVFTGGDKAPKYLGQNGDPEKRLAWGLDDRAAVQEDENVKQQKRDKDQDLIREALLPIRRVIYRRRAQAARSAVIQAVIAELWRPLTIAELED